MHHTSSLVAIALLSTTTLCFGQTRWQKLATTNDPGPRGVPSMAFDRNIDRVLLFGGIKPRGLGADTWVLAGTNWRQISTPAAPRERAIASMFFDAKRSRMIVFGGLVILGILGDTWELDARTGTWTELLPRVSPPARYGATVVYDEKRQRAVMFGGYSNGRLDDTWEFVSATGEWRQVRTATTPPKRVHAAMAYDDDRQVVVMFGGGDVTLTDTWEYDGVDWTRRRPPSTPGGETARMVYDRDRKRCVLYGGGGPASTWEWDGSIWRSRALSGPVFARQLPGLAYDRAERRVVLMGGESHMAVFDDTWCYGPWKQAQYAPGGTGCAGTLGVPPLSRRSPTEWPWKGYTFHVDVTKIPGPGVALGVLGFSDTIWGGNRLPLDLGVFGMAGCSLRVRPDVVYPLAVSGGRASVDLVIPKQLSAVGVSFYQQVFVADPGANPAGTIVSNSVGGVVGSK